MDTNEQFTDQEVETLEAEVEELEGETEEVKDTTDYKAKLDEAQGQLKRALKQLEKSKIEKKVEEKLQQKQGELDETQLDYLDVKGITEQEDIDVVESIVKKTGMTVRQALKDDYVIGKLEKLKAAREVKEATPSATKRGGSGGGNDLALAIAKYEQSGYKDLPSDFKLRSAVINAVTEKSDPNKPSWR